MTDFIKREDVIKRIDVVLGSEPNAWNKKALKELRMYIAEAVLSADVVEVVRCKDCTRQCICYHSKEYYCSAGERIQRIHE